MQIHALAMIGYATRLRRRLMEALGSDRYSHLALNELDRKLKRYLDVEGGFFLEAGANDGLSQSNSYWFEAFRNWCGVLVEGVPELARECAKNRPRAKVFHAALVADDATTQVTMKTAHLMSLVAGAFGSEAADRSHVEQGIAVQKLGAGAAREIRVPARTLTSILAEVRPARFDLLSLDVEGYEVQALKGLDLDRFCPRYILVEARSPPDVERLLASRYDHVDQLSHHDHLFAARPC